MLVFFAMSSGSLFTRLYMDGYSLQMWKVAVWMNWISSLGQSTMVIFWLGKWVRGY